MHLVMRPCGVCNSSKVFSEKNAVNDSSGAPRTRALGRSFQHMLSHSYNPICSVGRVDICQSICKSVRARYGSVTKRKESDTKV